VIAASPTLPWRLRLHAHFSPTPTLTKEHVLYKTVVFSTLALVVASGSAGAQEFDSYGAASAQLVAPKTGPDLVFELGGGVSWEPIYEGSGTYALGFSPIIGLDRLHIPGLIDIGGDEEGSGFSVSPAFDITGGRTSSDHAELRGLDDVAATYALGGSIGYDLALTENVKAGIYGELLYGFGAGEGALGEVGAKLTAKLTPELEISGGASADLAGEKYMDAYFGVSATESARTGGRMQAYDASGGMKSVNLNIAVRYEFMPDTFLNADASYRRYAGSAASSPLVAQGSGQQFTFGLGISRRFAVSY